MKKLFMSFGMAILLLLLTKPVEAVAESEMYTLSFEMNGFGEEVPSQQIEKGHCAVEPETPVAEGLIFDGWYTDGGTGYRFSFASTFSHDVTLTARWKPDYSVSYQDSEGNPISTFEKGKTVTVVVSVGGSTSNVDGFYGSFDPGTVSLTTSSASSTITLPTDYSAEPISGTFYIQRITYKGHEFGVSYKNDILINSRTSYTITYDMNGYGTQIEPQVVSVGNSTIAPSNPEETGLKFDGWYYADGSRFTFGDGIGMDLTLHAHWKMDATLSVTNSQGASTTSIEPGEAVTFTLTGMPESVSSKVSGASFSMYPAMGGFYGGADLGDIGDITGLSKTVTVETGGMYQYSVSSVTFNGNNVDFNAQGMITVAYPRVSCTVTRTDSSEPEINQMLSFSVSDYSVSESYLSGGKFTVSYKGPDDAYFSTLVEEPFTGNMFSYTPTAIGEYKFSVSKMNYKSNEVGANCSSVSVSIKAETPTELPEKPLEYTVSFYNGGHGGTIANQTIKAGGNASRPTDPVDTGWIFEGWYGDATLKHLFDFSTVIGTNTTLYAKWTEGKKYVMLDGENATWDEKSNSELTFRSEASFDKFMYVIIDGFGFFYIENSPYEDAALEAAKSALDRKTKSASESQTPVDFTPYAAGGGTNMRFETGSTKVIMAPEFLRTLGGGKHTIEIVSTDGVAKTEFTINAAPATKPDEEPKPTEGPKPTEEPKTTPEPTKAPENKDKPDDTPKTGDNVLPFVLGMILILGAAFAGTGYAKRK